MKTTKKSLLASGLVLLLCAAMLIGATFAWFTDTVRNTGNTIAAGNLDVSFQYRDLDSAGTYQVVPETAAEMGKLFANQLWEPGYTNGLDLKVVNEGDLALKWQLCFTNVVSTDATDDDTASDIADVLDVYLIGVEEDESALTEANKLGTLSALADGFVDSGVLRTKGEETAFSVVLKMQESAGNTYQGCSVAFDVELRATQATYEKDGFGSDQYDAAATLDFVPASTEAELSEAIAAGDAVVLSNDIVLTQKIVATGDVTIIGNGNTISVPDGVDRVLDLSNTTEPITITLTGVNLQGPTTGSYTRGISLYNNAGPVELILDDCSVSANYYALNVASANADVDLTVRNTTLTGWCAFQTHSPNANVTFESCTLIGNNTFPYSEWNSFGTILINKYSDGNPDPDGAHDSTITLKNCRIEANQTTGNDQHLLDVRAINTTVNVENCTFYVDGQQLTTLEEIVPHVAVDEGAASTLKLYMDGQLIPIQ